jgi:ribosomal protein S4E
MSHHAQNEKRNNPMKTKPQPTRKLTDGAQCKVIGGVHAGKSGTVRDINTSKTGHLTITVVQSSGECFKTLAKNVLAHGKAA